MCTNAATFTCKLIFQLHLHTLKASEDLVPIKFYIRRWLLLLNYNLHMRRVM